MNLAEAKALGLKYTAPKRLGRGVGSGLGKTSGRGHKGARARSGWSRRLGWEGGQMPLFRRLPKRGFNNKIFTKTYTIVNVQDLSGFEDGAVVDLTAVLAKGLVSKAKGSELFKILGKGAIGKKLTVKVDAISESARAKIEGAGGSVEILPQRQMRPKFIRKDGTRSVRRKPADDKKPAAGAAAGKPAAGKPAAGKPAGNPAGDAPPQE